MPNLLKDDYQKWLERLDEETNRSTEIFVKQFLRKYGNHHQHLPLWMVAEIITFGSLLTLFRGMGNSLKRVVATEYEIPDITFESWLVALNAVRNICAHHGRLWNRVLGCRPKLPKERKYPDWHIPIKISNNRIFVILTILKYLISRFSPQFTWADSIKELLDKNPEISLNSMGFPPNWGKCPLWQ